MIADVVLVHRLSLLWYFELLRWNKSVSILGLLILWDHVLNQYLSVMILLSSWATIHIFTLKSTFVLFGKFWLRGDVTLENLLVKVVCQASFTVLVLWGTHIWWEKVNLLRLTSGPLGYYLNLIVLNFFLSLLLRMIVHNCESYTADQRIREPQKFFI